MIRLVRLEILSAALLALSGLLEPVSRPSRPVGPPPPARDLDVGVPSGSPLAWSDALPAFSPQPWGQLPRSESTRVKGADQRSSARPARRELEVGLSSSFSLVRILTWDLTAHMTWIGPRRGARSGSDDARWSDSDCCSRSRWLTSTSVTRKPAHAASTGM